MLAQHGWSSKNSQRRSHPVGQGKPNAWGLYDMHGNAAEWTRSVYLSYPYREFNTVDGDVARRRMVVRGGSWRDRPARCRSSFRASYSDYQRVFNVGFRVVIEERRGPVQAGNRTGQ